MGERTFWAEYHDYALIDGVCHRPDPGRRQRTLCAATIPTGTVIRKKPYRKAGTCDACFKRLRQLRVGIQGHKEPRQRDVDATAPAIGAIRPEFLDVRRKQNDSAAKNRAADEADKLDRRRQAGASIKAVSGGLPTLGTRHR